MIYKIAFLVVTIYIFFKAVGYAVYEINDKRNKSGGVCVILISLFSVVFSNVVMWVN